VTAVLGAASPQDGGAQNEDAAGAEDVDGEGDAVISPNPKKAVPVEIEPEEKEVVNALASNGLAGVEAVVRIARIVNRCSAIVYSNFGPVGVDSATIMLYQQYGEDIIRGALYDLWQYIVTRQKLTPMYYSARHPTNNVLTTDFVIPLGLLGLERLGFPTNRMMYSIFPGRFHWNSPYKERVLTILLLHACRERSGLIRDFVKLDKLEERCAALEVEKAVIQDEIKSLRESLKSVIPGWTRLR